MMWLENETRTTDPGPTKSSSVIFAKCENVPVNSQVVTMDTLPTEAILAVFSFLLEQDLCKVSRVCKRFRAIANDPILWKRLYKSLFEYDTPLFTFGPCRYDFIPLDKFHNTNPWKESFRQLYHGAHVRPGYEHKVSAGRNILYFDTILTAVLSYEIKARATKFSQIPVFIHAGVHIVTSLPLSGETALIGAGPGNVAETVLLECATSSSIVFVENNKRVYLGHMSINFSPTNETARLLGRYLFKVDCTCEPLLDHLIIVNTTSEENSTLMLLCDTIELTSGWPIVKHCVVRNFENMGHTLIDSSFEDDRYQLTTFGFKPGLPSLTRLISSCGSAEDLMLSAIRCPWVQHNILFKSSLNPCSEIPRYLLQMQRAENTT